MWYIRYFKESKWLNFMLIFILDHCWIFIFWSISCNNFLLVCCGLWFLFLKVIYITLNLSLVHGHNASILLGLLKELISRVISKKQFFGQYELVWYILLQKIFHVCKIEFTGPTKKIYVWYTGFNFVLKNNLFLFSWVPCPFSKKP